MLRIERYLFFVGWFCMMATPCSPQLVLPAVLSDHMVMQRGVEVCLWGQAQPGSEVEADLNGTSAIAKVDRDGRWRVALPAMPGGGAHDITVACSTGETRVIRDVLFGEVWLCSGQSNMEWPVPDAEDGREALEAPTDDRIRLFHVPRRTSDVPIDDMQAQWKQPLPENLKWFSAVGYFMGQRLRAELDVPVGLIHNPYGGAPAEAWVPAADLEAEPILQPIVREMRRKEEAHAQALAASSEASTDEEGEAPLQQEASPFGDPGYKPAGLWHGMTQPLAPLRLAGTIWYQGESNVDQPEQYVTLLRTLMEVWRREFEQPEMAFVIVQLSSFSDPHPYTRYWPELREAQAEVADRDPRAGLVVTLDVGDPHDIHPTDKRAVGERAAAWILHHLHGRAEVSPAGPVVESISRVGRKIHVQYETYGRGLQALDGGPVRGFVLGNDTGWWTWARAEIAGDTVVLSVEHMDRPTHVRYGWNDDASWANLGNDQGQPAGPFRSDTPAWIKGVDWERVED